MADIGPMKTAGNYRIMTYGPKEDGTHVVEFRTAAENRVGSHSALSRTDAVWAVRAGGALEDSLSHGVLARNHCEGPGP